MDVAVVGLVPMKAHSERVPDKNVRPFNGKPLYHWVVESLLRAESITSVLINTDSPRILEEAPTLDERVAVVERPEALRGDFVPMNDILVHDVDHVDADYYLQTHATSPLLTPESIDKAMRQFLNSGDHDSLFSVTRLQTRLWDAAGKPANHDPNELIRTQDLEPIYEENSAFFVFGREILKERGNRIGYSPIMYEISPLEAMDIDEELDFKVAELLHAERLAGTV